MLKPEELAIFGIACAGRKQPEILIAGKKLFVVQTSPTREMTA